MILIGNLISIVSVKYKLHEEYYIMYRERYKMETVGQRFDLSNYEVIRAKRALSPT